MAKTPVTLSEARAALKALGYTLKTRRNSSFISGIVTDAKGAQVSGVNALSPEFFATHKPFFDYKESHSITDGDWRVIL